MGVLSVTILNHSSLRNWLKEIGSCVFVMQIFTLVVATRCFVLLFSLKVLSAVVLMRE